MCFPWLLGQNDLSYQESLESNTKREDSTQPKLSVFVYSQCCIAKPFLIMAQSHGPFWALFSITVTFLLPTDHSYHPTHTHQAFSQLANVSVLRARCILNLPSSLHSLPSCLSEVSFLTLVLGGHLHWLVPWSVWLQPLTPLLSAYCYQINLSKAQWYIFFPPPEWEPN